MLRRWVRHHPAEPPLAQHPGRLPGATGYTQTELCATLLGQPAPTFHLLTISLLNKLSVQKHKSLISILSSICC